MRLPVIAVLALVVCAGAPFSIASSHAQQLMALRAEWNDLQTWSTPVGNTREVEMGLGLQLTGPSGGTLLAFMARMNTRNPTVPPQDVVAQIAVGTLANPNVVRRPVLSFDGETADGKAVALDLTGSLTVDDSTPGGSAQNGIAVFPAAEFVRLTTATRIKTNIFGFEADLRPDQIKAMQDFAKSLHLSARK